jgi:hypothetical protein
VERGEKATRIRRQQQQRESICSSFSFHFMGVYESLTKFMSVDPQSNTIITTTEKKKSEKKK